jgi:cystathionine beta-synthase
VIFHDHGTRYLAKMFNDDWMRKKGYLDHSELTARDLVAARPSAPLFTLDRRETVARAVQAMTEHDYSQLPVTDGGRFIGSITETRLYQAIVQDPEVKSRTVDTIMQPAFPFADVSMDMGALSRMITPENAAVLVRDFKTQETFIVTRWDVIRALGVSAA